MKVILQGRQTGKTTELIDLAVRDDLYIVVPNTGFARSVFQIAKDQGKVIRMPITWHEFITGQYYGKNINGFVIDELGLCLEYSTSVPIKAVTLSQGGQI